MKNENEEWKELCELVANETDPIILSRHLDRLIQALDARKQALREVRGSGKPVGRSHEREK